jgi:hypothetical protein
VCACVFVCVCVCVSERLVHIHKINVLVTFFLLECYKLIFMELCRIKHIFVPVSYLERKKKKLFTPARFVQFYFDFRHLVSDTFSSIIEIAEPWDPSF